MDWIMDTRCEMVSHRGKVTQLNWSNGATMFVAYGMTGKLVIGGGSIFES